MTVVQDDEDTYMILRFIFSSKIQKQLFHIQRAQTGWLLIRIMYKLELTTVTLCTVKLDNQKKD
jgi:hypothetical protein